MRILFCGLESVDLHIERVAARVKRCGQHIPTDKIRQRYESSISNLVGLISVCHQLPVFDNSEPLKGGKPSPVRLFQLDGDKLAQPPVEGMPEWAKPLAGTALRMFHVHLPAGTLSSCAVSFRPRPCKKRRFRSPDQFPAGRWARGPFARSRSTRRQCRGCTAPKLRKQLTR